jgi:hypothetical protein
MEAAAGGPPLMSLLLPHAFPSHRYGTTDLNPILSPIVAISQLYVSGQSAYSLVSFYFTNRELHLHKIM